MSAKWSKATLGELTEWSSGGTPSKKNNTFWGGDIPWISASSMHGSRYSDSDLKITLEGLKSGSRIAPRGSILLLVRGSILHQRIPVGIATTDVAFNQDVKSISVKDGFFEKKIVDNWYLFYWIRANENKFLSIVESTGIGAGKLDTKQLQNLVVEYPSWNEQRRIISFCKALEEREIVNHQINQTLEQMAQAIFKSWFVDFEPVKAKMEAKKSWHALQPGNEPASPVCYAGEPQPLPDLETYMNLAAMQAISGKTPEQLARMEREQPDQYARLRATAELFPSAMQPSELGEIPEGWDCLPLDKIAKYQNGLALQKYRPENEDEYLPVVKIAQLKKGCADGNEKASPNIKPECIIDDGDVVFSWSGSLMVDIWCGGKAALNQHLFKVTSKLYPKWLYYYFTKHHLDEFQRIAAAKAVTMGHIKREHLKSALCAVPCEKLIKVGTMVIGALIDKQIETRLESQNLAQLRDTLLPKLLSGELTLPDTEEAQTDCQDVAHG